MSQLKIKTSGAGLRLIAYHVQAITVQANPQYDAETGPRLRLSDLAVNLSAVEPAEGAESAEPLQYGVRLELRQQTGADANSPYEFAMTLDGSFKLHPSVNEADPEAYVLRNAGPVLYGLAREILRDAMAKGPFFPLILPSLAFAVDREDGERHAEEDDGTI